MEFNIKKYIDALREDHIQTPTELEAIKEILLVYIPHIKNEHIMFEKNILRLKNISPSQKTFVKLRKNKIQQEAKAKNILIRDII